MGTLKQTSMQKELACGLRFCTETKLNKLQCEEIGCGVLPLRCILVSKWQLGVFPNYIFVKG